MVWNQSTDVEEFACHDCGSREAAIPPDGPGPKYRVTCCGDIIQSKFRHDLVFCRCGTNYIDGGNAYTRRGGKPECFQLVEEDIDDGQDAHPRPAGAGEDRGTVGDRREGQDPPQRAA